MASNKIALHKARAVVLYHHNGSYKNDLDTNIPLNDNPSNYSSIEIIFFAGSISSTARAVLFMSGINNTAYYPCMQNSSFNWVRCGLTSEYLELVASSYSSLYVRTITAFV